MNELSKPVKPEILACVDNDKWILKINPDGIFFNHDDYPNALPNDFAKAFIEILEKEYVVTFTKREKNNMVNG